MCIRFPGGATLCAQYGFDSGDVNEVVRSLMAQVNSGLMPLDPFFKVIEAFKAVVDCVTAVPDAIIQLDPSGLLECMPEMVKKLAALLQLIPQLSVPALVKDILNAIVIALFGIRQEIAACIRQNTRLLAAETRAAELGNEDLAAVVVCAKANLAAQLANHNASMTPMNKLLGVVNFLLGLAGLPEVELLPDLGSELEPEILDIIDVAIAIMQTAADAIPV
jgi:hypothetical protein